MDLSRRGHRRPGRAAAPALVPLALLVLAWSAPARADVPPSCDWADSLITCAAADVGKPCQGAGRCYAVSCFVPGSGTTAMTVYKCYACPTVLDAPDAGCSTTNMGRACGDGGTCSVNSSWCAGTGPKYICGVPASAQPTGPPAGEGGAGGGSATGGSVGSGGASPTVGSGGASATGTGGSNGGGGGCTLVTGVPAAAGIAAGLIAVGLGLLGVSRRRRPR